MTADRLIGVSARLLAGASALTVVALALVIRSAWQQLGQSFGPDGSSTTPDVPFGHRATLMVFESSYRPMGVQLLLASALVAAAVVVLHRHASWEHVRRLRWEVLAAGLLVVVVVLGLVLVNVYVMTKPDGATGDAAGWIGPQPLTELIVGNLTMLSAALLTLTGAMLWWLRLAPAPEQDDPGDDELEDDRPMSVEQEPAAEGSAAGRSPRVTSGSAHDESTADYSRDWSPEDFRPAR